MTKTAQGRGRGRMDVVRSVADIEAIHTELDQARIEQNAWSAQQRANRNLLFPHLNLLRDKFGSSKSLTLSDFIRRVREEGLPAVKAAMPPSTFYRTMNALREIGIDY